MICSTPPVLLGPFTLGAGQFCTKPGLALLPTGEAGDRVIEAIGSRVSERKSVLDSEVCDDVNELRQRTLGRVVVAIGQPTQDQPVHDGGDHPAQNRYWQ